MYKCSKCGKGVLVIENHEPVRICDCKVTIELPSGEKKEKNAPIICDMEGTAYGRSQFKN